RPGAAEAGGAPGPHQTGRERDDHDRHADHDQGAHDDDERHERPRMAAVRPRELHQILLGSFSMTSEDKTQRHSVTATTAEAGMRLDRLLATHATTLSRSRVKALVESGPVPAERAPISDPSSRGKPGP